MHRPVLAAVQQLQAVQPNVGGMPKACALDAVADSLQV